MRILLTCFDAICHFKHFYVLAKALKSLGEQVYFSTGIIKKNEIEQIGAIYVEDAYFKPPFNEKYNSGLNTWKKEWINRKINIIKHINPDIIIVEGLLNFVAQTLKIIGVPYISIPTTPFLTKEMFLPESSYIYEHYFNDNEIDELSFSQKNQIINFIKHYSKDIKGSLSLDNCTNLLFSSLKIEPFSGYLLNNNKFKSIYFGLFNMSYEKQMNIQKKNKTILIKVWNNYNDPPGNFLPYFYKMCISAFENTTYEVYLAIFSNFNIQELGEIPKNIHIYCNYINQLEILSFADIFISHLGYCGYKEAIYYNVPIIGIPLSFDQYAVAISVIKNNVGIVLDKNKLTAKKIIGAVNKIFSNKTYYENTKSLYKDSISLGGEKHMAEYIVNNYNKSISF